MFQMVLNVLFDLPNLSVIQGYYQIQVDPINFMCRLTSPS